MFKFIKTLFKRQNKLENTPIGLLLVLKEAYEQSSTNSGELSKYRGLCECVSRLKISGKITEEQACKLRDIIYNYRPPFDFNCGLYFWEKYSYPPRIEYINKLINKYS